METRFEDNSLDAIISRFDKSSSENLLRSIAKEIYRLGQANAVLTARVMAMETLQIIIDRIARAADEADAKVFPTSVILDATHSIPGSWGFHNLEYDETGRPFRWTGPDRNFSFPVFVNRRVPLEFKLSFGRICGGFPIEGIRAFLDGEPIQIQSDVSSHGQMITGKITKREVIGGTVLTFVCPATTSPATFESNDDHRLLGLSFYSLAITSISMPDQLKNRLSRVEEPV